jgi:uncharacterized protein YigA (DUF484 family)
MVLARADQKRASNEGTTAESKASQAQFDRLEKEIERLTERVVTLEQAGVAKDVTIAELTALKLQVLAERAAERVVHTAALAERDAIITMLRAQERGPGSLAAAAEHVAEATERVADAAESAIRGSRS